VYQRRVEKALPGNGEVHRGKEERILQGSGEKVLSGKGEVLQKSTEHLGNDSDLVIGTKSPPRLKPGGSVKKFVCSRLVKDPR